MEALNRIEEFLSTGSGHGHGDGDGTGDGDGHGHGYGDGTGYGYGHGDGDGYGYGYGYGHGYGDGTGDGYGDGAISLVNGDQLYSIDGIPTRIDKVKSQIAKGAIFNSDFTFTPCFIAKYNGFFAHGEHAGDALRAAIEKYEENMPEVDRIDAFVRAHQSGGLYPNADFFQWHHKLTGSCEMGRKQFAKNHGIDMSASMTVQEFIKLTERDYGGETIQKLKPYYGMEE